MRNLSAFEIEVVSGGVKKGGGSKPKAPAPANPPSSTKDDVKSAVIQKAVSDAIDAVTEKAGEAWTTVKSWFGADAGGQESFDDYAGADPYTNRQVEPEAYV